MKPQQHRQHHIIIQLIRTPNGYAHEKIEFVDNIHPNNTIQTNEMPARLQSRTQLSALVNQPHLLGQNDSLIKTGLSTLVQDTHNKFNGDAMVSNIQIMKVPMLSAITDLKHAPKWFSVDRVHDLQMEALPEFFNGKSYKTLELYRKYRDFIVRLNQAQPYKYLTKIACRRALKGDANAIHRIHRFLEEQGIINFGLNPSDCIEFGNSTVNRSGELALNMKQIPPLKPTQMKSNQLNSESLIFSVTSRILSKNYRSFCVRCRLTCGVVMFQRKQASNDSSICETCYLKLDQAEKLEYEKNDVVKRIISEPNAKTRSTWSVDENYKMIEALSEKNATWSTIQQNMTNRRTKEDIIFHFLQFPITNVLPNNLPIEQELKISTQQQIRVIRELYERSLYKYDMSEETKQLFNRQPLNEDLKTIILLELEKYSKRLLVMEDLEAVHILNEIKSNITSIIMNLRLLKISVKEEAVKVEQLELPGMVATTSMNAYNPSMGSEQSNQDFFNNGDDDVDRYLQ